TLIGRHLVQEAGRRRKLAGRSETIDVPRVPRSPLAVHETQTERALLEVVIDHALAITRRDLDVAPRGAEQLRRGQVHLQETAARTGPEGVASEQRNGVVPAQVPADEGVAPP